MKIKRTSNVWNLHAHSRFSVNDALPDVKDMVATVAGYGQKALGLTDHGNMAGSVQLYQHCAKAGIKPFPGSELYVVHDRNDKKAKRHHMCVVAYTTEGYQNLVKLSTLTHANFYNKPIIDHADLAELSEHGMLKGIAATSGCYFGFIAQSVVKGDINYAQSLMKTYDGWFDKFYVELQNHNIDHGDGWNDDMLADQIMVIAQEIGIPAVLTQDSHYCHQEDQEIHNELKRLVAFGPDTEDAVFPGDGFGLADTLWLKEHHDAKRYAYGEAGLADLLSAHDLSIPELDTYHYSIPFTVADPNAALKERCTQHLDDMGFGKSEKVKYLARLDEELSIIKDTRQAGYLLLVAEVTDWCRLNKIFYQARGSASGSITCWLLRITQEDPLKWGLSFERFISRDRTKPADIDLDVEHERRKELIEWLRGRFSVTQIGTWMEYSLHGEDTDDEGAKGSLRVKYYSARSRRGEPVGEWSEVPKADKDALHALANYKSFSSYGTHAAGLVLTTTDEEFNRLVPTMWIASSGTMVTQYEMNDIEKLGLVKLDVLGLKTLTVLHRCMDNLGRDVFSGLSWIPNSDPKTFSRITAGKTAGVFQLEGYAAQRGCMDLKPTKVSDVIAAMALFRPATQNSGATKSYINRRKKSEIVPMRHHIIEKNTVKTYGIMLFQEQVISILRDLGMNADDLTAFLKAVKASNADIGGAGQVIEGYRQQVKGMAEDVGFTPADWDWLWHAIEGFAAYGFNQAHSTAYGLTAYRCAYLATNHPVEFYSALLNVAAGTKKEPDYIAAVRKEGLSIRKADVNVSGVSYAVDPRKDSIRKGILAIKGVGEKSAVDIVEKRPEGGYESMDQFVHLVDHRKVTGVKPFIESGDLDVGVLGKLYEAGALDTLLDAR
jgi:DNA polymerase III subunit alpha